jgi:hypothetical protein
MRLQRLADRVHRRSEAEQREGQRLLRRLVDPHRGRPFSDRLVARAAEDRPNPRVGVLQVGSRVALECQHPIPFEDVVLDPIGREIGVLDRPDADDACDVGARREIEVGVLLRHGGGRALGGLVEQIQ